MSGKEPKKPGIQLDLELKSFEASRRNADLSTVRAEAAGNVIFAEARKIWLKISAQKDTILQRRQSFGLKAEPYQL